MDVNTENLMSVREYAEKIGKTTQRVYQMLNEEDCKIPHVVISDTKYILKDQLKSE